MWKKMLLELAAGGLSCRATREEKEMNMATNQRDHEEFLAALNEYLEARRVVDSIRREHISSGTGFLPSENPGTSATFADWMKRLRDAESAEQRCREKLEEFYRV